MGADKTAASLLVQGLTDSQIADRLNARFGPISVGTTADILAFAHRMTSAAEALQDTPFTSEYDLSLIPTNPYLWGGNAERGRGQLFGTMSAGGGASPRFFRYDFAAAPTPLDLFTQFEINLPNWADKYPGKFNAYVEGKAGDFSFLLQWAVKMF